MVFGLPRAPSRHNYVVPLDEPIIWLDGLVLPYVNILDANLFEDDVSGDGQMQPIYRPSENSHYRWGRNLRPAWKKPRDSTVSPILNHRWKPSRDALHHLREEAGSPFDGIILQYTTPSTGGPTLPTIAAYLQLIRKSERTQKHRHTSSAVYHVAEGEGGGLIGDTEFEWREEDAVVLPSWMPHEHWSAGGEAVLFSYSDRPILNALRLYREKSAPRA